MNYLISARKIFLIVVLGLLGLLFFNISWVFGSEAEAKSEAKESQAQQVESKISLENLSDQFQALEKGFLFLSECIVVNFDRNLMRGMSGRDVACLKTMLNIENEKNQTHKKFEYFDDTTKRAVINFQNLHKKEILSPLFLKQGTGYVGPKTRIKLNQILKEGLTEQFDILAGIIKDVEDISKKISIIYPSEAKTEKQEKEQEENEKKKSAPSPTPTPTPIPEQPMIGCSFVSGGEQIYSVNTKNNPQIAEITITPLDAKASEIQVVKVKIRDKEGRPVFAVTARGILDNISTSFDLTLIGGTNTEGIWQGNWILPKNFCKKYQLLITAQGESGESSITLTFI